MIVQLPNNETAEFPDSMSPEEIEKILAQQFPKEPERRGIVSKAAELALQRPFELLTSPLSAAYHGFWKGSEEFGKLMTGEKPSIERIGEEIQRVISAPYRPLEEKYPEFTTPSKIAGVSGLGAIPIDIALDPLLPVMFGKNITERMGRMAAPEGLISKYFREPYAGKLPTLPELMPESVQAPIIPPEVPSPPTWRMGQNLPMVVEKPKPLPKSLFEFDVSLGRKKINPETLMGKDLAENRIGKPLKVEVGIGQEANEKIFKLVDKSNKTYAELGLKADEANKTLEISWLNIDAGSIPVEMRRAYRTGMEVKPIKGLNQLIHSNLELYARENNYNIIGVSPAAGNGDRLRYMGYLDIPADKVGELPYTMFKRVEQRVNFVPDFNQKLKTLKIAEDIGFLNAQKASEINDMAVRRSMFFDVSKEKEYVFFNKTGDEINKFKNIDEAENFVKNIKITPSDYWITQQAEFKRAEVLYRKTVENTATKNIEETMKYPKAFEKEVIEPTYKKFVQEPLPVKKPSVVTVTKETKKVDEAINSINSVFDTGTGEIVALGNKVIPIRESLFNVLKSIKEVPNDFYERIITAKGWLKNPQQFFEQQPDKRIKEVFYRRIKEAEKNMTVEVINLKSEIKQTTKSLNLNNKNFDRIGTFAIAQDENGLRTLQVMKKEIPTLTENETQFYNFIRSKYEEFFNRINEAREFVGIKPIDYRGDYFTFFRNYDELEKLGYHITDGSLAEHINRFVHKSSTVFMHEKMRKGGIIPLETNALDVFSRYATKSVEHIHMTPAVGINRALLKDMVVDSKNFSIKDNAPRFYTWMNKWLDDIAGQRATTELPHFLERTMNALNRNIVFSMLSYNIRSALIQPSALVSSFTELGPKYLMEGIINYLKSPKMSEVMKKSKVLLPRQYDESVVEAFKMVKEPGLFTKFIEGISGEIFPSMRRISRGYKGGKQVIAKIGMKPLQFLDAQTAKMTWEGAYQKGTKYLKLSENDAINYADDVVIKTQASGRISDLSAAQRTPLGKTLFLLQTFVINNWNYLARDVAGISNPNIKSKEAFEKIMKYVIGVTFTNTLFEDILGTYSPFPTPVKAYLKEREKGGSIPEAMFRSTREMAELIPGPGGAIRFGSHPGGPLMEVIGAAGRKTTGRIEYKKSPEIMGMLFGIPMTSQVKKIYTGEKYGASTIESMLGMVEPPEKRPKRIQRERKR